jgi:hypothetical protein
MTTAPSPPQLSSVSGGHFEQPSTPIPDFDNTTQQPSIIMESLASEPGSVEASVGPGLVEASIDDAPAKDETPEVCVYGSDATFGVQLRNQFLETARVIRRSHGITVVKELGDDPQLDNLVGEVMGSFQRLKVRLLKVSNQEAQFRLDLETRISNGIWNQYDISDDIDEGNKDGDFLVYQAASPPHTPR